MSARVWKFTVGSDVTMMPRAAKLLAFGVQPIDRGWGAAWVVWAQVDPDEPLVARRVAVVATGQEMPSHCWTHVGTVISADGYGAHCFDGGEVAS